MDIPRKIGTCVIMIIPTFVGGGALWDIFHSWFVAFIWVVVMAFAPELYRPGVSEQFVFTRSFPILVANAVFWTTQRVAEEGMSRHEPTGELVGPLEGTQITWQTPADGAARPWQADAVAEETLPLRGGVAELDRIGLWRTDAEQTEHGSASLLSRDETLLHDATDDVETAGTAAVDGFGLVSGDLTDELIVLLLAVLVIESWLFHRHAVY